MNYDINKRNEIEEYVLASILIDRSALAKVIEEHRVDSTDYFRKLYHKEAFRIILYLYKNNIPVSIDSVFYHQYYSLGKDEKPFWDKNMDYNLVIISQKCSSSAYLDHYLLILKEYVIRDFWNEKSSDVLENSWDHRDVFDVSDNIVNGYQLLLDKLVPKKMTSSSIESIEEQRKKIQSGQIVFVPYPIAAINDFTGGMVAPELSILAARPSMGKSTLALIFAIYASILSGHKGLFISLEMSLKQLINKVITDRIGMDYQKIRKMQFTDEEWVLYKAVYKEVYEHNNLKFYDSTEAGSLRLIKKLIEEQKPRYVIIDYLQLIQTNGFSKNNREQEIAHISRTLKSYCLEFDIPIIALAQLSRNVETRNREHKRPLLSDLRESGAIEQDADNVFFLYRDAYYREQRKEFVNDIEKGNIEFIISKGRDTGLKSFDLWIDFKNYSLEDGFKNEFSSNPALPPAPPIA